jgi:hypothetical protein
MRLVAVQSLPRSASEYAREQRTEIEAAVAAVQRQWRRMGTEFDASYSVIEPTLLDVVQTAQERVAAGAQEYVPAVLEETGQSRAVEPFARVSTAPLVGVAGDGRPVDSLLYEAVVGARVAVADGATARQALVQRGEWLTQTVGTLLSDTGRASESLATGVRPVGGYVRMLNPPSCSRCAVLAGKYYRKNTGFLRHPGCDCRHIPAAESVGDDLTVNVAEYFDSLSPAEQGRVFTNAGAEAIRNGADINQVVNARRGMRTAQIGGRDTLVTLEGTTRRGMAYRYLAPSGTAARQGEYVARLTRNGPEVRRVTRTVANRPRLMPETIQRVATDREDYLRLLRANGYLLPTF